MGPKSFFFLFIQTQLFHRLKTTSLFCMYVVVSLSVRTFLPDNFVSLIINTRVSTYLSRHTKKRSWYCKRNKCWTATTRKWKKRRASKIEIDYSLLFLEYQWFICMQNSQDEVNGWTGLKMTKKKKRTILWYITISLLSLRVLFFSVQPTINVSPDDILYTNIWYPNTYIQTGAYSVRNLHSMSMTWYSSLNGLVMEYVLSCCRFFIHCKYTHTWIPSKKIHVTMELLPKSR